MRTKQDLGEKKKKKNGKESALSPERPTAEETAQKRNLDTLASRRKLTTTGDLKSSININRIKKKKKKKKNRKKKKKKKKE